VRDHGLESRIRATRLRGQEFVSRLAAEPEAGLAT